MEPYHRGMFTGLVQAVGEVRGVEPSGETVRLRIHLGPLAGEALPGDSIAVAGTCLTLSGPLEAGVGAFDVVRETLERTCLGALGPGSRVNLEPSLRMGDRLGGHLVQGHVDGVGKVRSLGGPAGAVVLAVEASEAVTRHLIEKGSVTVDGVSLTVVEADREGFTVALVPHTLEVTTLGSLQPGDRVNLEGDPVGKWVRRILGESGCPR